MRRRTLLATGCSVPLAFAARAWPDSRVPVIGGPCVLGRNIPGYR